MTLLSSPLGSTEVCLAVFSCRLVPPTVRFLDAYCRHYAYITGARDGALRRMKNMAYQSEA